MAIVRMSTYALYLADDPRRLGLWRTAAGDTPIDTWARSVLDAACVGHCNDTIEVRLARLEQALKDRGLATGTRELLTPKELGDIYKTTTNTILKWYRSGCIPAEVAEGSIYRFNLHDVQQALKQSALTRMQKE